jgi:hypothetical protein
MPGDGASHNRRGVTARPSRPANPVGATIIVDTPTATIGTVRPRRLGRGANGALAVSHARQIL